MNINLSESDKQKIIKLSKDVDMDKLKSEIDSFFDNYINENNIHNTMLFSAIISQFAIGIGIDGEEKGLNIHTTIQSVLSSIERSIKSMIVQWRESREV